MYYLCLLYFISVFHHYSVLDLDSFERTNKAEGLGLSSDAGPGEKNLHDAEFTCKLFRFLQLLCEGHNLGMQMKQILATFKFYLIFKQFIHICR